MGVIRTPPESLDRPVPAAKSDIAREFGKASGTYDQASRLQRLMGEAMLARLAQKNVAPRTILDLGCGTGWFTRELQTRFPEAHIVGVDLSPGMIEKAKSSSPESIQWLTADAESLPFSSDTFDLIFSNLMIQWCQHPQTVLAQCRRLLRSEGRLAISTLLDGTLWELKQAWSVADPGQPHVNRFEQPEIWRDITGDVLTGSDLVTETIRLSYDSPMALNRELKLLGAGFKGEGRRKSVTAPGRFKLMSRAYPSEDDGCILATYESAFVFWRAP
ncbi:malonyl-ACP O-methyltransferase BioC [Marinobacter pelagius]|uniref:Malonyl-[acyl-carrier protein] O-methyltransferase n=1 Tax=Marinobacter pelagius TaxID=379482 RepID=A0A1I4UPS4_9GAMM|nr:malonyl-ACP O-methyltransferase BioC [Marinobacter pelagius]SFM90931.1 malonyl-CoA O-methyltransferase [Marinobacter pelagius]